MCFTILSAVIMFTMIICFINFITDIPFSEGKIICFNVSF